MIKEYIIPAVFISLFMLIIFSAGYVKDLKENQAKSFCKEHNLSYKFKSVGADRFPHYICYNSTGYYEVNRYDGKWKFDE